MQRQENYYSQASGDNISNEDIKILFYTILKRWWLIAICMIISTGAAYAYTQYTYYPIYSTTTSMVINSNQTKLVGQDVVYINDINLSRQLVDTYTVIFTSNKVIQYVISDLGLNMPASYIRSCVSISTNKNAGILYLTVRNIDPNLALAISNSIMEVAPDIINETVAVGSVKVLDEAGLPEYPIPPSIVNNCLYGILIGFVLGIAIIVIRKFLKPTFMRSNEIKSILDLTVMGSIPHLKSKRTGKYKIPLIINQHIGINFYESIKSLRTNVLYWTEKKNIHTILITGATENDGKTTNAINLALSLCPQYKVLLIDADILNPNILRELHLNVNTGILLKNLIDFPDSYSKHIAIEPNTGLAVLSLRGSKSSQNRASDLFGMPQFKSLLDRIKQDYDYVIIDSPPAKMLADASILSQYVDGVILSIRQDHAPIDLILQTRDDFMMVQAKILGCIFNDVKHISLDSSDRYRYYERK